MPSSKSNTVVDSSVVYIRDVLRLTEHMTRVKPGSLKPCSYVVTVAFPCVPPLAPFQEPPKGGDVIQVRLNLIQMAWLMRKLVVSYDSACVGKFFSVDPRWKARNAGFALDCLLDEIVQKVHILAFSNAESKAFSESYRLQLGFISRRRLDGMNFIIRALYIWLNALSALLLGRSNLSAITLTKEEYMYFASTLWLQDPDVPSKECVGVSFDVSPKWDVRTPTHAMMICMLDRASVEQGMSR